MKTTASPQRRHADRVRRRLAALYPEAASALDYADPLQLLVATILSAQCTDARVNKVTPELFARYPNAEAFAAAKPKELEEMIRSTGYFRNKARNIVRCCKQLVKRHGGRVPGVLEELVKLTGVGRKTANCVLGGAFQTPGITVDTHVGRLSRRLGLSGEKNPVKVERDLMALIPRKDWTSFSHRLILHGRRVCRSRRPRCEDCGLSGLCPRIGVEARL
jgi:endonuclease-3